MPTRTFYRQWCQKCQDWELFHAVSYEDKTIVCTVCKTPHAKTLLKEIPEEKLIEQRERFKAKRKAGYKNMLNELMMDQESRNILEMVHMFSPPGYDDEIIEGDAGQKAIDEIYAERRRKEIEEREAKKQEAKVECAIYGNTRRNDECACGSHKKYKKCCMDRIEGLMLQYNLRF